jgi:hypothetical protein
MEFFLLEFITLFNEQTANWLLFSAGWVAAFRSRLAKISRCPSTRVPDSQGGTAMGPLANPKRRVGQVIILNRFSHRRSTPSEKGSRK